MQKALIAFSVSMVLGTLIVFGCSAPSADGSNVNGTKKGTSSSSGNGDNGTTTSSSGATTSASSTSTSGAVGGSCAGHASVDDNAACNTCTLTKCCDSVLACDKQADCKLVQTCLQACAQDDFTCGLTCQAAHENGSNTLQEVGACAQTSCPECAGEIPDGGSSGDLADAL